MSLEVNSVPLAAELTSIRTRVLGVKQCAVKVEGFSIFICKHAQFGIALLNCVSRRIANMANQFASRASCGRNVMAVLPLHQPQLAQDDTAHEPL